MASPMQSRGVGAPRPILSAPALAVALRTLDGRSFHRLPPTALDERLLPPMYRVRGDSEEAEIESATRMISELVERLRRLTGAYGEWRDFDAPAYFDLPAASAATLVRVVERVSTVHVLFYTDPLLPTFQRASNFWAAALIPAYANHQETPEAYRHFWEELQPAMAAQWQGLVQVLTGVRSRLMEDIGFLTTSGALDERLRWQREWRNGAVPGLQAIVETDLTTVPTLTLALDFSLPTHRQPNRLRRLRHNRARRQQRRRGFRT